MKQEYYLDFQTGNRIIYELLHNALLFEEPSRSIMALLDYMEMILRVTSYYFCIKNQDKVEGRDGNEKHFESKVVNCNLQTLGEHIVDCASEEDEIYNSITNTTYQRTECLDEILKKLEDFLWVEFKDNEVDFLGISSLLRLIRNKVTAHGTIHDDNAYPVWSFISYPKLLWYRITIIVYRNILYSV